MRLSKNLFALILIAILFALPTFAQRRNPVKRAAKPTAANSNETAAAAFEQIKTASDANQRIEKLTEFIAKFPLSDLKPTAVEFLIVSHVQIGENDFQTGDAANGIEEFKSAAKAFDRSVGDKLYNDIIGKLPYNVFFRAKLPDERAAAIEIAKIIEPKVAANPARLLGLANFYLAAENAQEAKRLAAHVAEIEPNSAEAQTVLGMANRIDFKLEESARNYRRAVELDPASLQVKRNLADVQRGLGQNAQALELYRELLTANANDEAARAGLILALFNSKQKEQAEQELTNALIQNPKNFQLQTNAAYWYAANGDAAKAVELATQAVAAEPRYVWAQIALARGLILQKQPLEAERALLVAKQYGNFPTLDYELANAHLAAGLFDEARDDLSRSFAINKKGKLTTKLAGRADIAADDFNELLNAERRASTFQFESASSAAEIKKLKELLIFSDFLSANNNETAAQTAAVNFADGTDEMQTHRQLYAANRLLSSKKSLPTVAELTRAATGNVEQSLNVPSATAAVLADELYEPRRAALARGQVVNVPTLDRETLSKILRGRIEELAGWTLFQENKFDEAAIRLRRAVGILPEKSAWWRSSLWKLGNALDAAGKPREALNPLAISYKADQPNEIRLAAVRAVYQRVNGSLAGFEQFLDQPNASQNRTANPASGNNPSQPNPNLRPTQPGAKNPLPSVIAEIVTKPNEPSTAAIAAAAPKPTAAPPVVPETKLRTLPAPDETPAPTPTPEIIRQPEAAPVQETAGQTVVNQPETTETAPIKLPMVESPSNENLLEKPVEEPIATPIEKTVEQPIEKAETEKVETEKSEQNAPQVVIVPLTKTETSGGKSVDIRPSVAEPKSSQKPALIEPVNEPATNNAPRVVVQNINEAATANQSSRNQIKIEPANQPCALQISSKQISLFRNGGKTVLIAAASSAELAGQIKFSVNSPTDLAIVPQENRDGNDFSRMFEVRSTSEITKTFVITFELPCAKQEVTVRVR